MVLLDGPWSRFGEPTLPRWLNCWIEHGLLFSLVFYIVWIERLSIFAFVDSLLSAKDGSRQNSYEWYLLSLKMGLILMTCINSILYFLVSFAWINMAEDNVGKERVPPVRDKFNKKSKRSSSYRAIRKFQPGELVTEQQKRFDQFYSMLSIKTDLNAYVTSAMHALYTARQLHGFDKIVSQRKCQTGHRGDLSLLHCNEPINIDLEGIPSSATCDQVVEYLRSIDPTLDFTGTAVKVEVQPPVCMVTGEAASTTKARVTNFEISSNLRQFIRCGNSSGEVPTSLFVRRHFKTKFKLELMVGEELRLLIAQMEDANWEKWEIESWILIIVTHSMKTTARPVTLRINVMQFQGRVMQRLPCSRGRILLLFDDFKDVIEFGAHISSALSACKENLVTFSTSGEELGSSCVCGSAGEATVLCGCGTCLSSCGTDQFFGARGDKSCDEGESDTCCSCVDKILGVGDSLSCGSDGAGTSDSKVEGVRCDDGDDAECYTDDSQRQYSAENKSGLQEARDLCCCFSGNAAQGGSCACESDGFIGVKSVGTHHGSNVDGTCGYGMKTRMAGCCDDGDELAHSSSCGVFATRGSCHSDISDESACEGGCGNRSCCGTAYTSCRDIPCCGGGGDGLLQLHRGGDVGCVGNDSSSGVTNRGMMIRRHRHSCSSSCDGSGEADVGDDFYDGADGGGYCEFNWTDRVDNSGGAGVQGSRSNGGRSIAQRGGRRGADALTSTLLMDLVLDIVLIRPVALVVPISGSTGPGEPV